MRGHRAAALVFVVVALMARSTAQSATSSRFPLRVSGDQRHLEDAAGKPFLVVGDAAWSLVAQLDDSNASRYLEDRARRGFTAVIVNLIEHKFATRAPANHAGVSPFLEPGNFRKPNPVYFESAHRVVAEAGSRGLSVWLCPAYLGWQGGDEGFFKEIKKAGPDALYAYGKSVGERFKDLPNIVWMVGGDDALAPQDRWAAEQLVWGLRDGGAEQLATAHGGQTSAVETYGNTRWLSIDTVYSYKPDLRPDLLRAREGRPARPFVLIETIYEGEHDATPDQIRRQAWQAMLAGAAGQFFGNNPIWHFDGPTLFPFQGDWMQALDSPGARDMARLARFFAAREWWTLEPRPHAGATVTMAGAPGGATVIYVAGNGTTNPQEIALTIPALSPSAQWFNPAKDEPMRPVGSPGATGNATQVTTPGDNGTGTNDWVIVD
jgi:hypothetical protein